MATVTMIVVTGEDVVDEDLVHSCSTRALDGPVRMVTEPVVDRASPGASSPATAGSGLRQTIVTVSPQSPSRCFCLWTAPPGAWSSCLYMPRGRGGGVGRAELTWGGGSAPAARSSTTPPSAPRTAASLRCRRHRSSWARGGAVQLIIPGEKDIGGGGGGNVPAPPAEGGGSRKQRRRALAEAAPAALNGAGAAVQRAVLRPDRSTPSRWATNPNIITAGRSTHSPAVISSTTLR